MQKKKPLLDKNNNKNYKTNSIINESIHTGREFDFRTFYLKEKIKNKINDLIDDLDLSTLIQDNKIELNFNLILDPEENINLNETKDTINENIHNPIEESNIEDCFNRIQQIKNEINQINQTESIPKKNKNTPTSINIYSPQSNFSFYSKVLKN